MVEEVLMWVLEGLLRGIVVGSVKLSQSYGKTYLTVFHSFSFFFFFFSIRLSFWSTWKEKYSGGGKGVY